MYVHLNKWGKNVYTRRYLFLIRINTLPENIIWYLAVITEETSIGLQIGAHALLNEYFQHFKASLPSQFLALKPLPLLVVYVVFFYILGSVSFFCAHGQVLKLINVCNIRFSPCLYQMTAAKGPIKKKKKKKKKKKNFF